MMTGVLANQTSTTLLLMATRRIERRLVTIVASNQQPPRRVDVRLNAINVYSAVGAPARERLKGVVTTTPGKAFFLRIVGRVIGFLTPCVCDDASRLLRTFFGAILPLAVALFFGSAPFPDWQWWRTQSRTPTIVTTSLPDGIRNGRAQKQKYSLNVTDCPGLFPSLVAILLPNLNRIYSFFFFPRLCARYAR